MDAQVTTAPTPAAQRQRRRTWLIILTLAIMIITCSPKRTLTGAPAELSITR